MDSEPGVTGLRQGLRNPRKDSARDGGLRGYGTPLKGASVTPTPSPVPQSVTPQPPDLLVRLRLIGPGPEDSGSLKRLLKHLLRAYRLQCVDLADLPQDQPTRPTVTPTGKAF